MAVFPGGWELALLLCKLCLYGGVASLAGGSLCLWQFSDGRRATVTQLLMYMMVGALIGFQAVLVSFLVQIGQINGAGFAGMFDWGMATLLLDTSVGEVSLMRLAAFTWALLATLLYLRRLKYATKPFARHFYVRLWIGYTLAVLLLAASFRLSGHASQLPVTGQLGIVIHVCAMAAWIGSLYPLLLLSRSPDRASLETGMRRFGTVAIGILVALMAAGALMSLQLLQSFSDLLTTAWGRVLLMKLVAVAVLLGIAARNKFILVPDSGQDTGVARLSRSIQVEILVACVVLVLTAYFSTIVGPPEH